MEIEKIYQKKSQLEHILLRPDTYIGSVELLQQEMWIWDFEAEKMIKKEISFVPGLYKIFDEILGKVNIGKGLFTIDLNLNHSISSECLWQQATRQEHVRDKNQHKQGDQYNQGVQQRPRHTSGDAQGREDPGAHTYIWPFAYLE